MLLAPSIHQWYDIAINVQTLNLFYFIRFQDLIEGNFEEMISRTTIIQSYLFSKKWDVISAIFQLFIILFISFTLNEGKIWKKYTFNFIAQLHFKASHCDANFLKIEYVLNAIYTSVVQYCYIECFLKNNFMAMCKL